MLANQQGPNDTQPPRTPEQQAAIELVLDILDRNPKALHFNPTLREINHLANCILEHKFKHVIAMYGQDMIIEILREHERMELFETCKDICDQIEDYNVYVPEDCKIKTK